MQEEDWGKPVHKDLGHGRMVAFKCALLLLSMSLTIEVGLTMLSHGENSVHLCMGLALANNSLVTECQHAMVRWGSLSLSGCIGARSSYSRLGLKLLG